MPSLLDDFNRSNEDPLTGSLYGPLLATSISMKLVSNQTVGKTSSAGLNDCSYDTVFAADQSCQLKVTTLPTRYIRRYVRMSAQSTSANGYFIQWAVSSPLLRIFRSDGGTPVQLASDDSVSLATNDTVRLEAVGTVLTVYRNGSSVLSYDTSGDSTIYNSSGRVGFGVGDLTGAQDDFYGGDASLYPSFISSATTVYTPQLNGYVTVPFISSVTALNAPQVVDAAANVAVPFIPSATDVKDLFSVFGDFVGSGGGNGGETFPIELAPTGTSVTATLVNGLTPTSSVLTLSGDSGLPTTFCLTIDSEVIYVSQIGTGTYRIRGRGMSNTTAVSHAASTSAVWDDTYDMALTSDANADADFTADILSTGSFTYYGWVIAYDSTQAYLSGNKYPAHVSELVGVFAPGDTTNKLDGPQPNAICVPAATSNDCPAALSVPGRIATDIETGDVALVRYFNTEASILTLTARTCGLQTWYGMKRVDDTNNDVTLTDPDPPSASGHGAHIVDTVVGTAAYTASVEDVFFEPLTNGIAPDTGAAITNAFFTTVTLSGTDRYFTYGAPHYSDNGWPICCLAVRNETRRVPYWASYDWHNFGFVYTGFTADATYAQIVINRNGMTDPSSPVYALPGPQDIDGPNALWDDNTYHFSAAWYVAIFDAPFFLVGPGIGPGGTPPNTGPVGTVAFPVSGGGGTVTFPGTPIEGGHGGGINPPGFGSAQRFNATVV